MVLLFGTGWRLGLGVWGLVVVPLSSFPAVKICLVGRSLFKGSMGAVGVVGISRDGSHMITTASRCAATRIIEDCRKPFLT